MSRDDNLPLLVMFFDQIENEWAHGKPVLFLHPKDFCGTLIELEQA